MIVDPENVQRLYELLGTLEEAEALGTDKACWELAAALAKKGVWVPPDGAEVRESTTVLIPQQTVWDDVRFVHDDRGLRAQFQAGSQVIDVTDSYLAWVEDQPKVQERRYSWPL